VLCPGPASRWSTHARLAAERTGNFAHSPCSQIVVTLSLWRFVYDLCPPKCNGLSRLSSFSCVSIFHHFSNEIGHKMGIPWSSEVQPRPNFPGLRRDGWPEPKPNPKKIRPCRTVNLCTPRVGQSSLESTCRTAWLFFKRTDTRPESRLARSKGPKAAWCESIFDLLRGWWHLRTRAWSWLQEFRGVRAAQKFLWLHQAA